MHISTCYKISKLNYNVRVLRMPVDAVLNDIHNIFHCFSIISKFFFTIIYRRFCVFPNKLTTALIVYQLNTFDDDVEFKIKQGLDIVKIFHLWFPL